MTVEVKPGYKQTEVGVIPEEWEVRSIGQMFQLINGCAFRPEDWKQSGTPIIRIQNLNDPYAPFNYSRAPVAEKNRVEPGDLLFAWSGTIGTSFGARVWSGPSGVLNQHIFRVHMDQQQITLPFSRLIFSRIEEDIAKQAHGFKASFVHVKKSDLIKVNLPLPPIPEQRAITEALSDVDALLAGLDRLIAKKRNLKQAAMQQLLTGKTRLPGFKGEWEVKRLKDVAELNRQNVVPSSQPNQLFVHFSLPAFDEGKNAPIELGSAIGSNKFRVPPDAVLVSKLNPRIPRIWAPDRIPQNAVASTEWLVLTPCEGTDRSFLFALCSLSYFCQQMEVAATGTTGSHQRISPNTALDIRITAPVNREEQTAIATILSDMDAELSALEARRDKTRALKQAMMQELLTGKTRLVARPSNVIAVDFAARTKSAPVGQPATKSHNWQINEAVVVAVLVKNFGSEQYPLGRKRCTKLAYLMHRHAEHVAQGYLKKAAGPYNPAVKYKGPEGIAQKNGYIRPHTNGNFSGYVAAENIAQAESYFQEWYGQEVMDWLEQFRKQTNDELELLATVDMAVEDLRCANQRVGVEAVKGVIRNHPEWEAKLERAIFSDSNIARAIRRTGELFPTGVTP